MTRSLLMTCTVHTAGLALVLSWTPIASSQVLRSHVGPWAGGAAGKAIVLAGDCDGDSVGDYAFSSDYSTPTLSHR